MSKLVRRVSPFVVQALTSPRTRALRRRAAELRRRLRGEPHRVLYFHQVDDPYSQLAAQLLGELVRRYDVALEPSLVGPPPDDAAPERERLRAFSHKDAADVAPGYGIEFPRGTQEPAGAAVELATRILCAASPEVFPNLAPRVGAALYAEGLAGLELLAAEVRPASSEAAAAALASGSALRSRRGHYLGAMFLYGGEWYWGVDRFQHLERRLQALGALRAGADRTPIAPRPDYTGEAAHASQERLTLEFYPSLRSPYSAIVTERVLALARRRSLDLVLRPVLPMVMRGLPVPRAKRLYIVQDSKREADDAGVPFGFASDPVGRPVERAFSLFPWAREQDRHRELLAEMMRACWSEGVDLGSDRGLRLVVERAGLSWQQARDHVDVDSFADELEANRKQLFELGLWGVPSFRLRGRRGDEPDFCSWGQDRLWRVEQEILRRV